MRRPGLLFLVAALACGTTSSQRAGQSLQPAADTTGSLEDPMLACVDAVTANSRIFAHVTKVRSTARSREYSLALRNLPGLGFAAHSSPDGTKGFVVAFLWPGPWMGSLGGGMKPPPDPGVHEGAGEMVRHIGAGFLRDVRAECAPTMPGEPTCVRVNQGRGGRCSLAGK